MANPHLPAGWDQPELLPAHRSEWVDKSGVAPEIVQLNVKSLTGDEVLQALLGHRLERAGSHAQQFVTGEIKGLINSRSQLLSGGWWCEGLCAKTLSPSLEGWGHFKPDDPRVSDGRTHKYEHPVGVPERIVVLAMPEPNYWADIKADPTITLVLDEGAKKAGAWLTAGVPCLGLPGLWAGTPPVDSKDHEPCIGRGYGNHQPAKQKDRRLHPDLEAFAPDRRFVISFDWEVDAKGRRRRDAATRLLAEKLFAAGASSVAIAHRDGPEKGADDLLVSKGPAALKTLLETAELFDRGPIKPSFELQASKPLTGNHRTSDLLANHIAARIYAANGVAVLDHLTNVPGTGKSHLVPEIAPRLLEIDGIDRIIYVSSTYRSPSIPALSRWMAPVSRHGGLVVEEIDGEQRLRRRKSSDPASLLNVESPNCQYSANLQRLRNQGVSTEAIRDFCKTSCPNRVGCRYLLEQRLFIEALKGIQRGPEKFFRCSVESIPTIRQWLGQADWAKTYLIFDEAPQLESAAVKTKVIPIGQLPAWGTYLRVKKPRLMATGAGLQLSVLLDALSTLPERITDPAQARYGLTPQQLLRHLPPVPELNAMDLGQLDCGIRDLPTDQDRQHQTDAPHLLPELLKALQTSQPNAHSTRAFFNRDGVNLVSADLGLQESALVAAGSLVLDGTAATQDINHVLHGGRIFEAESELAHLNPLAVNTPTDCRPACLEVIQITDLGPMGAIRGDDKQRRLEALLPAIKRYVTDRFGPDAHTGVLEKSHYRSRESGHGVWFVDNQGSNAYQHDKALVLIGCPAHNLTAALAQFQVSRRDPHATFDSDSFRHWYARRMGEQLIQGIHRLRPIRRQGETLRFFLITSTDLSKLPLKTSASSFKVMSSAYFTEAAAPKAERTKRSVINAIKKLREMGETMANVSTRRVGDIAGCSHTQARRQAGADGWKDFVATHYGPL